MRGMNVKYRTGVGRDGDIQLVALRLAQGKLTAHGGQEKNPPFGALVRPN
jgi:hypothetical protein